MYITNTLNIIAIVLLIVLCAGIQMILFNFFSQNIKKIIW